MSPQTVPGSGSVLDPAVLTGGDVISTTATGDVTAVLQAQLDAIPDGVPVVPDVEVIRAAFDRETAKAKGGFSPPVFLAWLEGLRDELFPSSRRVVQFVGGPYQVEGTLTVKDRNNLELRGFDLFATVPAPYGNKVKDRTRSHLRTIGGSNIKLVGKVKGAHPNGGTSSDAYVAALEAQHGIEVNGTQGFEVVCDISDVYGDFVYLVGGCANGYLHDGTWTRNGRQGFSPTHCSDILLERVAISEVRRALVDIEPYAATQVVRRVTHRDCDFGASRLNFFSCASTAPAVVEDVTFEDIRSPNHSLVSEIRAPANGRRKNFTFRNVNCGQGYGSPQGYVVYFENVDGVHMHGCTQPVSSTRPMYLAKTVNCTDVDVSLNDNSVPNALGALKPNG